MLHSVNKIKFKSGKDANKMLIRKLAINFLQSGKMITTLKKAKVMKSTMEKLVEKTKENKESNKNYLLRYFPSVKTINTLFDQVGPSVKNITGGYVRVVKLNQRDSDGTMMAQLEWAHPITIDWSKTEKVEKKEVKPKAEKVTKKTK